MDDTTKVPTGPDFGAGIPFASLPEGRMVLGHAHGEPMLLLRRGDELFAIGATCTHYGGPLGEGLLVDDTVRCPWHHACFSLRTGEALRAPALDPVPRWHVEQREGLVYVEEKLEPPVPHPLTVTAATPKAIVIIGGGAAGNAAAEMLRREGFTGYITLLSADGSPPCDRPRLSKGYLSGAASEASTLLRTPDFYKEHDIALMLGARVQDIDTARQQVHLDDDSRHDYDALLLATGAEVVRLRVPGHNLPHVHYLRSFNDSYALVAGAQHAGRAVVIGASFIGLEVAASLRARHVDVHVVAPEAIPMQKVLGEDVGRFIRQLHEAHGVTFHLGTTAAAIDASGVTLESGEHLEADLVVVGIGVRPAIALAERAGLEIDRGVVVDAYLETSVPGIFAAGDIARWPDRLTGERIRIEHWVVAERQGQSAARNMLGRREPFDAVPFFWTRQYDFGLSYIGHAERWDEAELEGKLDVATRDCKVTYRLAGKTLAVAVVNRDMDGLRAEAELEAAILGDPA